jgi:tetratricopeptide (TPR) repeat protein
MMTTPSSDAMQQVDRIAGLLLKLLEARSLSDAARVLRDNPELLSSMTLALLTALKKQAGGVDEEDITAQITFFERLIRRSSEVGLDVAIEEAASGVPASPASAILSEAAAFPAVPEDLESLEDLIARLISSAEDERNEPPETRAALLSEAARLSLRRKDGGDTARNKAIGLFRAAAELSPQDSPMRARCLAQLASALLDEYRRTREPDQLDEALSAFQAAMNSALPNQPNWDGSTLSNYVAALMEKYLRNGRVEDLERAIEIAMINVRISEPGTSEFAIQWINVAALLTYRYRRSGLLSDLDEAADAITLAVDAHLPPETESVARTNLGNVLRERYAVSGNAEDLHNATTAYMRALELTAIDSPDYPERLGNLAALYAERFFLTGDGQDLDQAVNLGNEAVEKTPAGFPELVTQLGNHALALKLRHEFGGEPLDRASAISSYQRAVALGLKHHSPVAVLVASQWGRWASSRSSWQEAAKAYGDAFAILEDLLRRTHSWRDRESYLSAAPGLPENAAYALMRSGRTRDAVVALERSRTRLLDEALARYAPELVALSEGRNGRLAADFRVAVRHSLTTELKPSGSPASSPEVPVGAAVEAIRAVRGFGRFLEPVDYRRIAATARQGPLVYIAAAQNGGLALVIRDSSTEPESLSLPELTEERLATRVAEFMSAYDRRSREPSGWLAVNDATLRWLWDAAMGPVVAAVPEARAIMLPMGLLTMLPLHAAWTSDASRTGGRRYVLDSHLITYACSARSLPAPRSHLKKPDDRFVMIGLSPGSRGGDTLPGAEVSHDSALRWFGDIVELRSPYPRRLVFDALKSNDFVHFACPMHTDLVDPVTTCLTIGTQVRLTVRALVTGPGSKTSIAVVPAGQSALPGAHLPNELISIPTGLHAAGVSAVLACLWEVDDLSARTIIDKFYSNWRDLQMEPPDALRAAQAWARNVSVKELGSEISTEIANRVSLRDPGANDRPFASPIHWAGFVYSGV